MSFKQKQENGGQSGGELGEWLPGTALLMGGLGGAVGFLAGSLRRGRGETVCPGCGRRVSGEAAVPTSTRGLYRCPCCGSMLDE